MERDIRKNCLPQVIIGSVMSLYRGAKMEVRMKSELSEERLVQVGVHQGSVLSPLLCNCGECNYGKCKRKLDE